VQIVESRPMSREKRWVVESVIKREIRTADAGVEAVASADVHLDETPAENETPSESQP
jgi:hypothetical protein